MGGGWRRSRLKKPGLRPGRTPRAPLCSGSQALPAADACWIATRWQCFESDLKARRPIVVICEGPGTAGCDGLVRVCEEGR